MTTTPQENLHNHNQQQQQQRHHSLAACYVSRPDVAAALRAQDLAGETLYDRLSSILAALLPGGNQRFGFPLLR